MKVDVVVVTHQSAQHVARALSTFGADASVVVVDNASKDATVSVARNSGFNVIVNDVNAGFASAANQGAAVGSHEAILFLNPDAVIDAANLARLVSGLIARPEVGIASPRIYYEDGTEQRVFWHYPSSRGTWSEAVGIHRVFGRRPEDGFVTGSCFLVRRSVFEQLGGFDTRFWLYGEETDFCRRALDHGWQVAVVDNARAEHVGGASVEQSSEAISEHFLRGTERFIADREGSPGVASFRLANVVGASLRSIAPGPWERRALHRSRLSRHVRAIVAHGGRVPLDSPATAASNHTLVVCSLEAWDDVWRRNQFFVRELLARDPNLRVLFVEPPHDRIHNSSAVRNDARRRRGIRPIRPDGRLHAFQPVKTLPRLIGPFADRSLSRQVQRAAALVGFVEPTLWVNDLAYTVLLATSWPTVYDITDDWTRAERSPRVRRRLAAMDRSFLQRANAVVVCSDNLAVSRRGRRGDLTVIPNAVDVEHFTTPQPRPTDLPDSPVAVYVGTLHEDRLDIDLIERLATADPELSVVLVGPVALARASSERIGRHANVYVLGARPYAEVPAYLQHADVVIVPHVVTPFTESLDPIKAYECRAVGRPTVATRVAGFRTDDEPIISADGEHFVDAVKNALVEQSPSSSQPTPSWSERAAAFEVVLVAARETKRCADPSRVVFVDHCAQLSGGEVALVRLISGLRNVHAHVILGEEGPLAGQLRAAGATVEILPLNERVRSTPRSHVRFGIGALAKAKATWNDINALRRRLRELDPDLVHTNSLKAAVYGGIAARLERFPVVWHIRDRIARDYLGQQGALAIRALALVIPTRIIYNSLATRESCRLPAAFRVSPGPVIYDSSAVFGPHDLTRSGRGMRFVMVGRLTYWKGQHVFLRAFAKAFPDGPEEAIVAGSPMFGEDKYADELQRLAEELGIADRVCFVGFIEDIPALLHSVDALVHASVIAEPFGQVVIEGMASALPVIASAAGGPLEVITPEINGILVPPDDATALATQLRRLRDSPELCQSLGAAAYRRAQDFSVEQVAARVQETWREVLAQSESGVVDERPSRLAHWSTLATARIAGRRSSASTSSNI